MVTGSRLSYKMPWLSQFFISSDLALIRDCIVRLLCGCTVILEIYTQYVHCYVFAINFKKAVVISQIFLQRAFFCCRGLFLYSGKNNKGKDIQCQNTAKQQFLLKVVGLRDTLLFDGLRGSIGWTTKLFYPFLCKFCRRYLGSRMVVQSGIESFDE